MSTKPISLCGTLADDPVLTDEADGTTTLSISIECPGTLEDPRTHETEYRILPLDLTLENPTEGSVPAPLVKGMEVVVTGHSGPDCGGFFAERVEPLSSATVDAGTLAFYKKCKAALKGKVNP